MGTTMSFYSIKNQGMTPEELQEKMKSASIPSGAVIGYSACAKWLPLFDKTYCDDDMESMTANQLSQMLGAPVILFSLYDSDFLFFSYCDAAHEISCESLKPPKPIIEAYELEECNTDLPQVLLDFCAPDKHDQLRKIWDATDAIFADDSMCEICHLLEAPILYDDSDIPAGFQAVYAP